MIEICLVTKDGITRQAYNGREMDDETAQWFVSRADYGRVVVQLQAAELKVKELERECSGLELLRREEQLARHEAQDHTEKAAEAKLAEYLSYTPKVPTQPYERDLAERLLKVEKERDEWRTKFERHDDIMDARGLYISRLRDENAALKTKLQRAREGLEKIKSGSGRAETLGLELYRCPQCASAEIARQALTEIEEK